MTRTTFETVQRLAFTAGPTDAHGNSAKGWADPVAVDVYAFDPGGTAEPRLPGHDRVITEPTLYFPPTVTFDAKDRVIARGLLYEVDGDTVEWVHPNGRTKGNVVALRRVDG